MARKGQVISIMLKNYDKRGSVLLMVVGLLVILGTLGGTFLLVSSLDARQSKLLAGRGKAELIASGGVGKVVRALGDDLHFLPVKASAPYTAPNIPADANDIIGYKFYIDYRSNNDTYTEDRHLHRDQNTPSNVFGYSKAKLDTFSKVSSESDDPNAVADAYLIPLGEFSDDGEQYYIAIKVVDMCSLLSLNTGGENYIKDTPDTSTILKSPALIRLKAWMTKQGGVYGDIHKARCGVDFDGTVKSITDYDRQCGRKLLSTEPELKYMPFAIADEVYLRWLGADRNANTKTNFSRVARKLRGNIGKNIDNLRMLTTINSSRSILRNPITGVVSARFDLSKTDALDSAGKDAFYTQLIFIAGSDDGKGGSVSEGITKVIDNSSSGFYYGHSWWFNTPSVPNTYNNSARRCKSPIKQCWWVFTDLPQANYRIWASWGSPTHTPASMVPYMVYEGGTITPIYPPPKARYSGGALKGMKVADQTQLPSDGSFGGAHWLSLGGYQAAGQLVVEIHGPQNVPVGEEHFAFADAVRIEGVSLSLGSGSQPAAHLTANTWVAISEYNAEKPKKAFAYRPQGKNYTVFGIQEQPFITEAFATHTTRTGNTNTDGVTTIVNANAWKWGAAIELMNFSSKEIDLSEDYRLVFGSALDNSTTLHAIPNNRKLKPVTDTEGKNRLVLYDFGAGDPAAAAKDVFGVEVTTAWERVTGLNFDNNDKTIRLVRIAKDNNDEDKTYNIPIDHIVAGDATKDLEYSQVTDKVKELDPPTAPKDQEISETNFSHCRRDDSATRHRYSVAKYSKFKSEPKVTKGAVNAIDKDSHKLARDNGITLATTKMTKDDLKEGFRIKLRHGLLSGPGELSDLYLVGPILYDDASSPPADIPELLKDFATKESRGRANSHAENSEHLKNDALPTWKAYPRKRGTTELAWPLLLGEIIETVPMDLGRGDSPTRVYGRINVNTASKEVLEQLPWPPNVAASTAAQKIIDYRNRNDREGFVTPGEVTLALDGFVKDDDPATKSLDRDSIYAAISSCITVNSDMYAVTVRVQLGGSKTPPADRSWYYLAVIDRGCAVFSTDKPAVLLFTQVK